MQRLFLRGLSSVRGAASARVRVSLIRAFSADTRAARDAATTAAPPASSERVAGAATKHTFQAETKQLLNIVANSLYTDKHVFIRCVRETGPPPPPPSPPFSNTRARPYLHTRGAPTPREC